MFLRTILIAATIVTTTTTTRAEATPADRKRVLITNDNGIDDPKIVALARAFAHEAETWVVAPDRDQSGTGSHVTFPATGALIVTRRDLGPGIEAFAVSGTPADCVVLATTGLMDAPPDLVVSGINGGDNAGTAWMFSGTVGAARVAAIGLPAVAVSGLNDDLPGAMEAAAEWVVRLCRHDIVTSLHAGEYLTVSMPRIPPAEIRGIRIVDRATGLPKPRFASEDGKTWRIVELFEPDSAAPEGSDVAVIEAGFIAVVPMHLDEVDLERLARLRRQSTELPAWRARDERR